MTKLEWLKKMKKMVVRGERKRSAESERGRGEESVKNERRKKSGVLVG